MTAPPPARPGVRDPGPAVSAGATAALGCLVAVTLWSQYQSGTRGASLALDLAAAVVSCALVPVLLRRPVAGAVVLIVLVAISPVATPPASFGALYVAQRRPFPVAAAVGAAGIAAEVTRAVWLPVGGLTFSWWLVLVVAAYAALVGWGALTQARQQLLDSLRDRACRAEEEQGRRIAEARVLERTRIAREMHDVLAHRLSLLATYAGAVEYRPDAPPEQLSRAAGVIRLGAHQALDELRQVITVLRDVDEERAGEPGDAGLGKTRPQPGLADLARLVAETRDVGTGVLLRDEVAEGDAAALPAATGRTAYRVVQEGLTNARKHAAGRRVSVTVAGSPGSSWSSRSATRSPEPRPRRPRPVPAPG